jgi:DnaJ-class molecular chaperone
MAGSEQCNLCNGTGSVFDHKKGQTITCPACGGSGQRDF